MARMTNQEILNLHQGLQNVLVYFGVVKSTKLGYAIAKNKNKLKSNVTDLRESMEPIDTKEFDKERMALARKHATKDEDGKLKRTPDGANYIMENPEKYDDELNVLKEKHKEILDARDAQRKEEKEMLAIEEEVDLHKVKYSDLPTDLPIGVTGVIFPFVIDDKDNPVPMYIFLL